MLQVTPKHRIFMAVSPIDFRCGINSLVAVCRNFLRLEPMTGSYFVFRNRKATSLKILCYDGQGFLLLQKRLSRGIFRYWPTQQDCVLRLDALQLQTLFYNGNPQAVQMDEPWHVI